MKYYILAGEASGDLHAAGLLQAIRKIDPQAQFRGMGGDACAEQSMEIFLHYKRQNFMGFTEILRHLPKILRNLREVRKDIQAWRPDVVVPVDYPGFNFRIMKWASKRGFQVDYFIPPQVWAWHSSRVHSLRIHCRQLLVIFPFEPDFYAKHGLNVHYIGNPLLDRLDLLHAKPKDETLQPMLALLPGSRTKEVEAVLPIMLQTLNRLPMLQARLAAMDHISKEIYLNLIEKHLENKKQLKVLYNQTPKILAKADLAWVTSGTATLETALFYVPQVVCYKAGALSVAIAKKLIQVPWISLVNLLLKQAAIPELIQQDLHPERLLKETNILLTSDGRNLQLNYFEQLRKALGDPGCLDEAARRIVWFEKEKGAQPRELS